MQIFSHPRLLPITGSLLLGVLFLSCAGAPGPAPEPEDERGLAVADSGRIDLPEKAGKDDAAGIVPPEEPPAVALPGTELPPEEGPPPEELSFGGLPAEEPPPEEGPPPEDLSFGRPPVERPPVEGPPAESIPIMGEGLADQVDMSAFLLSNNPGADPAFIEELTTLYLEESAIEGINHDIAFAQMCLETGYLR
ncbi:MAG: glucosaminidase domain-containing protein, partial [Spirochaetaceae bacterium]|nr:glucosaminidase domain-containing protein [Spirochaetaceae bacterium]